MKKFDGMLFCTDLDGTLFDDNKNVSKENLDAIEYFKSEGGLFTFITGRTQKDADRISKLIKPNAPYGCINGGGIYDPREEKYLWRAFLPKEAIELVKAVYTELDDIGIRLDTEKEIYFCRDSLTMRRFREITGIGNVSRNYEDVTEPVLKAVFGHPDEARMSALADLLNSHPRADLVDIIRPERALYEIMPKGVSKGAALLKMAELLGIDKSRTIAVGDYNNDISMIKAAGAGFAVANAIDEAKSVADYITVSNNDHAIAAIVDGLDKGLYIK